MLLDCLPIGKNKTKRRNNQQQQQHRSHCNKRSNSVQPTMSTNDTICSTSTHESRSVHQVHKEVYGKEHIPGVTREDFREYHKTLTTSTYTSTTFTSMEEINLETSRATPILFLSDGPPKQIQSWSESLDKLLHDPVAIQTFFLHLKSEHSTENLRFWIACENYKRSYRQSPSDLQKHTKQAQEIYKEFLSKRACSQVNLACSSLKEVKKRMSKPSEKMFECVQNEIYELMKEDSYPRFLKSERYLSLLHKEMNNNNEK